MNTSIDNKLYYDVISCNYTCNKNFYDKYYDVSTIKNVKHKIISFKSEDEYIKHFIRHLKEKVIRNFSNLNDLTIILNIFDKSNIIHNLILTVATLTIKFLKKKILVNPYKTIFVAVFHKNTIVFTSGVGF